MRNKTTNIYTEWKPLIDSLSDEDAGKIFKNIFSYQSGDDVDSTNPVWMFIKAKIDEYNANGVAISEARRNAGKIGMAKRWGKITSDNKNNICYQMLSKDNKNNNKIKENKIKEYTTDFETFWELYPKQRIGNKDKAFKAYKRVLDEKRCTADKLLEAVKKYRDCEDVKKGYAKGCEAWLNDDRFNWQYKESVDFDKYWL